MDRHIDAPPDESVPQPRSEAPLGANGNGVNGNGTDGNGVNGNSADGNSADGNGTGAGPLRVVVADDVDGVRELICLVLELEPDFTVVGRAANGAEAIELVVETAPDLVLLDVAMPVLDGMAALERVRRLAPAAQVVMFTGFSEPTLRADALALGAVDVVEKGLEPNLLVERLRQVCHRSSPA